MQVFEVLEKALALIEDERNWCGNRKSGRGPGGERCAALAVRDACYAERLSPEIDAWNEYERVWQLLADTADESVPDFNDTHSHAEVVELFQTAIREEKRKAGIPIELHPAPADEGVLDARGLDQARGIEEAAHVKRDAAPHSLSRPKASV